MNDFTYKTIQRIAFSTYSTEEIKRLSVLQITNIEILDALGHPAPGGLYDLRLGPSERDDFCGTCNLSFFQCPGHLGHIEFPITVFSPAFFNCVYQLLRGSCFYCHKLLASPVALHLVLYQLQALDYGLVKTVFDLAEVVTDIDNIALEDKFSEIQGKLQKTYKDAIKDLQPVSSNLNVKSVVECRRNIIKSFIKDHMMGVSGNCPHCKSPHRKINRNNMRLVYNTGKRPPIGATVAKVEDEYSAKELTAEEAKRHLQLLWQNEKAFLQLFYKCYYSDDLKIKDDEENVPIDMFFMSAILVSPCKFRRLNVMHGRKYADVVTLAYNEVLKDCHLVNKLLQHMKKIELDISDKDIISKVPGKNDADKFNYVYLQLQQHVYEIFDSEVNKNKGKTTKGFKQIVEKKQGLFRMNMMGKRVNYAARSVISPDPYIMVNEIGVPMVFAKKLTFKEPVNERNFERLQRAVMNGPNTYPGALLVETENGRIIRLSPDDPIKRQAIANTLLTPPAIKVIGGVKFVHRHLRNGDMLLLNRQPTLHKPSIMAHKARVLPGEKTLRLHYANCKSYNADFDGDEMNVHFPQSYLGQSEARHIVGVNHQYLVPKDGTPLSGLIQDHIIAGVLLTMRGRFFSKDYYQQLLFSAMSFHRKRIKLLPPAILKPKELWSGKQLVSSIIINLIPEGKLPPTLEGKSKVPSKNWKTTAAREWIAGGTPLQGDSMSESEVIIRHGELLCGVIDKSQIGPTPYSLVHVCYELYGGETSSLLLTALARLFTHFLNYNHGFTLGPEDIVVTHKANRKRSKILRKAGKNGRSACAQALNLEDTEHINTEELEFKYKDAHFSRDDFGLKMIDMEMKKVTNNLNNQINELCIPSGLTKKFPQNNLQLMIESGAKGSSVNAMQISCLLGQIELEGRRMPLMLNGSTLPSFLPYCTIPGAGGFVGGRFLSGIKPPEYFFHCMAGREGLIDTAVKTSRSGYLQRCLIKHLEGITINYDLTVRDSDGTIIQFLYGEDGLDPLKMQLLKNNRLHLLLKNYDASINNKEVETLKNLVKENIEKDKKKIIKWKKKHANDAKHRLAKIQALDVKDFSQPAERVNSIMKSIENVDDSFYKNYQQKTKKCIDPINSKYRPHLTFGAVTETLDSIISEYTANNPHRILNNNSSGSVSCEKFKDLCYYRAIKCLAEPGEAVGLLAAQSIGEPSTQMTLNTFHFAGKGEMNVTLGIPRLREILMTASANIATPTMDLPFLDKPGIEKKAEKLKLKLSPVPLKEVLEYVKIKEYISISPTMLSTRNYTIRFNFLDYKVYKDATNTTPSKNLYYIEHVFIKKLIEAIKKSLRQSASTTTLLSEGMKETKAFVKSEPKDDADEDAPPPETQLNFAEKDGESSAESEDEGDTTSAKSKRRHDQEQEYEDPEEDELLPDLNSVEYENQDVPIKQELVTSDEGYTTEEKYSEVLRKEKKYRKNSAILEENKPKRINTVKCIHSFVSNYDFDSVSEKWCEVTLQLALEGSKIDMKMITEEEINKAYVHAVPNINEAILIKNPNAEDGKPKFMLKTGGVNFLEIFKYVNILDINKVYSNNIQSIAQIYGIEAAASVIRKEIVNVFATYGITVDPRHLSLVADYMTCSGQYRPCNRIGMEGNASPLQQMTFETTTNFLVEAMLNGVEDKIQSPSSNVITGQYCRAGTGSCGLKVKYNGCN